MVYNDTVKMVRPQNIRLQQNHDVFWVMVISMYNLLRFVWPFQVSYSGSSAHDNYRDVCGITLAAVLWPVLSGALLLYFGLSLTDHQRWIGVVLVLPTGVLLLLVSGFFRMQKDFEPIRAFLYASSEPLDQKNQKNKKDQRVGIEAMIRIRNFQILSVRRVLLFQAPAFGLGFVMMTFLANRFLEFNLELWQLLIALLVSLMVGVVHAVFEFYALAPLMKHMTAMGRQQGVEMTPEDRKRIIRVDTKRKLLFVSAWIMSGPMLILGATLLIRVRSELYQASLVEQANAMMPGLIEWMLIVVAIGSIISLLISLRMALDTGDSERELSQAMRQVEEGNLDVSLLEKGSDEYADIFRRFNRMVHQLVERQRLHDAFGRFVSRELTEEVMKNGVNLGGQTLPVTIMFSDLRGFSVISESFPPFQVVEMLNVYLKEMTQVIDRYNGTINEIMGDGLLIVFGAPATHNDDAERAMACALEMQLAMPNVNAHLTNMGLPELEMGIGINSGQVVAGNVGSAMRTKYAVVGSAVNMAARVESFTIGGQVLATRATLDLIDAKLDVFGKFSTTFKGMKKPVTMYDVVGIAGDFKLYLQGVEIDFQRLSEPLPLRFKRVKGKTSANEMLSGSLLAVSENEKYGIMAASENLGLRANLKIALDTPLLPEDTDIYAKVLRVCDNGSYEINFTYINRNTRNFFNNLKSSEAV